MTRNDPRLPEMAEKRKGGAGGSQRSVELRKHERHREGEGPVEQCGHRGGERAHVGREQLAHQQPGDGACSRHGVCAPRTKLSHQQPRGGAPSAPPHPSQPCLERQPPARQQPRGGAEAEREGGDVANEGGEGEPSK